MKPTVETIVKQYVESWNNETIEVFRTEFSKCLSPSAHYTDPTIEVHGVESIAQLALESLQKSPGRKFSIAIEPEHHHAVARYTWNGSFPDGQVKGEDILEFDENGLIVRIITFFLKAA